jgi:hypothetical protein
VIDLDGREISRVPRDIGDQQAGGFRGHRRSQR